MSKEKVSLSVGITNFDNTNIKFLSNKENKEENNIEDLIHDWIDSKKDLRKEKTKKNSENENSDLKEKFMHRSDTEKEYRVNLIKNLHLEDKIKDDLLKDFILDSTSLNDPKLKTLEDEKKTLLKKMRIFVYLSVFYSFYVFAQYYDQRINKFSNMQDLINNKPRVSDMKFRNHFFVYGFLFGCLGLLYKQQIKIDNMYKYYMKNNYISLTDEDLTKYKVHMKL